MPTNRCYRPVTYMTVDSIASLVPTSEKAENFLNTTKCVLVIDEHLPVGVIANTAAVLSLGIGRLLPELIGHDLEDSSGAKRHGITTAAIPILKGSAGTLSALRAAVKPFEPQLTVLDLISATQTTKSYAEYADQMRATPESELQYLGIGLCGPTKMVNKFTGSLGLLR
jgi:hypothetical protein